MSSQVIRANPGFEVLLEDGHRASVIAWRLEGTTISTPVTAEQGLIPGNWNWNLLLPDGRVYDRDREQHFESYKEWLKATKAKAA